MTDNRIEQELRALKNHYRASLPDKLKEIQDLYHQAQKQPDNRTFIEELKLLVHRLRGTAGTYGFIGVSDAAANIEQQLERALNAPTLSLETLQSALTRLEQDIELTADESRHDLETNDNLLIVDDDPDFLLLISKLLTAKGFRATTTTHPEQVPALIEKLRPDLLLIDVEMPSIGGYELCRTVRRGPSGNSLPIVFLTSHNSPENRVAAFRAGGDDFINKPLVIEELTARINVRLASAKLAREKQEMLERLQYQHESLLLILDSLQIGTIIIDDTGTIVFMSDSCALLGGLNPEHAIGKPWQQELPFGLESLQQIRNQLLQPQDNSSRLRLKWEIQGKPYWAECEVRNVPSRPGHHLLSIYDKSEVQQLKQLIEQNRFGQMIGNSEPMRQMYTLIEQVAGGDWTVLIEGETGVGKELVAHSIHAASPRKDGPFIALNSAGLSESLLGSQLFGHRRGAFTGAIADQQGYFEAAASGTLFLDEIGDLPLSMQAALLRVLQEKEIIRVGDSKARKVDVRVIAATHKDLSNEVRAGRFREDLFYRLRVARIYVPPLRERRSDIPSLAQFFLSESSRSAGKAIGRIDDEAMLRLQTHDWPGNVRELKATLDYALIRCRGNRLSADDLPPELNRPAGASFLNDFNKNEAERDSFDIKPSSFFLSEDEERRRIHLALEKTRGNRTLAAKLLGMSRATFYRHLKILGLPTLK